MTLRRVTLKNMGYTNSILYIIEKANEKSLKMVVTHVGKSSERESIYVYCSEFYGESKNDVNFDF